MRSADSMIRSNRAVSRSALQYLKARSDVTADSRTYIMRNILYI
jgi:hypothetical protein